PITAVSAMPRSGTEALASMMGHTVDRTERRAGDLRDWEAMREESYLFQDEGPWRAKPSIPCPATTHRLSGAPRCHRRRPMSPNLAPRLDLSLLGRDPSHGWR